MAAVNEIKEVLDAIYAYMWTASNDFKTACLGGLHYDEYPKNKTIVYPYAVLSIVSWVSDRDSNSNKANGVIQLSLADDYKDNTRILQTLAEWNERFVDCENNLVMTNFKAITVDDINKGLRPPRRSIADRWETSKDYHISIDRK